MCLISSGSGWMLLCLCTKPVPPCDHCKLALSIFQPHVTVEARKKCKLFTPDMWPCQQNPRTAVSCLPCDAGADGAAAASSADREHSAVQETTRRTQWSIARRAKIGVKAFTLSGDLACWPVCWSGGRKAGPLHPPRGLKLWPGTDVAGRSGCCCCKQK